MEKNCCVFSVFYEIIHEFTGLETVASEGPEVFSVGISRLIMYKLQC